MSLPVPSAGKRLLKILGFALVQSLVFGGVIGLWVYLRPERSADPDGGTRGLFAYVEAPLENLERDLYDWRARELGLASHPSDDVVVVAIDDETLANARQDPHPALASRPWPRALIGGMVGLLADEGASSVIVDLPMSDSTPHSAKGDDDLFRQALEKRAGEAVLSFGWSDDVRPPVSAMLRPYLARVDEAQSRADALPAVRSILEQRRPAFVLPASGGGVSVWAGAESEEDAQHLGSKEVREFLARDRAAQVTPVDLFVSLAEVHVEGLEPEALPRIRNLEVPIPAVLSPKAGLGATTLARDADGEVRGIYQLVNYAPDSGPGHLLPSAPLAAAMEIAHTRRLRYQDGMLHVGDRFAFPMAPNGYSLIHWDADSTTRDARGSLKRSIPAWRVIVDLFDQAAGAPLHYQHDVAKKAVVIADGTRQSPEVVATPIGNGVPRGAVLGQALANILASEGIQRATPRADLFATLALAFFGALLALLFSGLVRSGLGAMVFLGIGAGAVLAYLLFARHLFVDRHLWLAAGGPSVAFGLTFGLTTLYAARTEREVHDFIQHALGRYVSPQVTRAVLRNLKLIRPVRRTVTLLRCDLEGFGRACEEMRPGEVAALLNTFLGEMTRVVREVGGQVEYAGDALLAFWGAPVRTEQHAELACQTALELCTALEKRRDEWEKRFERPIGFRIGIATGEVVAGDLGSELKSNYTAVGEPVNLSARLEAANAVYGTRVLCSARTAELCGDGFVLREIDEVMLRGSPQRLFELLGRKRQLDKMEQEHLREFETARELYKERRFADAIAHFERCDGDSVAAIYVERCRNYLVAPPPPEWRGLGDLRRRSEPPPAARRDG